MYYVSVWTVGGDVTKIICTSGNAQLGGSVFDAKIATQLHKLISAKDNVVTKRWPDHSDPYPSRQRPRGTLGVVR
jgi:molecular chaperone DnaK (HSP70)